MWLYWQDYIYVAARAADQLFSIGADMTSATSLSLSIQVQLITLWFESYEGVFLSCHFYIAAGWIWELFYVG